MLYSSKRGRGVLSAWSEGVGRCLYGGINRPLTTHDEPDEDSDFVDEEEEEEEPFHSNSTCAASGAACCDWHFARWRKMENSRTKIQTTRQLTWKLDWERSKLFSELDLYEVHFFALQGIAARQYASRFFRRIPVKRFFPPCSEWVMTNTIDIIVEFLKSLDQFSKTATSSSTVNIELVLSLASSPSTSQLRDCGANCTFSEQTRLPFLEAGAGGQRCKSAR